MCIRDSDNTGSYSVSNGILTITAGQGQKETLSQNYSNYPLFGDFKYRARVKAFIGQDVGSHSNFGLSTDGTKPVSADIAYVDEESDPTKDDATDAIALSYIDDLLGEANGGHVGNGFDVEKDNSSWYVDGSVNVDNTEYHVYQITRYGTTAKLYIDDVLKSTITTNVPTASLGVYFTAEVRPNYAITVSHEIDWVFIAKYIDPEPSHGAWYAEETAAVAYEITLTDVVGLLDSYSRSWSSVKLVADSLGLYDAVSPLRSAFKTLSDLLGLADRPYRFITSFRLEVADLADSYYTVKSQYRSFSEAVGILDARSMSSSRPVAEPLALLDRVSKSQLHIIYDSAGLSDRFSSYIFGKMVLADGIGLYDSFARTFTAYRTYSEPLGVYDALVVVKAQFRSFTELAGLADAVSKSTYIARSELTGLSDVIEKVFTAYRKYVDDIGLLDEVSKRPLRALADHAGLRDVASKSTSRRVEDSAALSDLVERHPAALIADSVSMLDAFEKLWTAHKEAVEAVGLLDALTPVKALFEEFSEPMALVDAFARKWDIKREYSEKVGLYDEVTRRWGKWILLTESIAAYDEEYLLRIRRAIARIKAPERVLPAFREKPPERVQGPESE